MNEVLVSINCITYNHEKYIADAIEGFLMQKTNFLYEILIGEDCSLDDTRNIVEEYVRKYPNKVKLITSDRNVGGKKNEQRLYKASRGKYIALCEGDDFWTDPYKLQKQVDFMKENSECSMCFHAAQIVDARNGKDIGKIRPYNEQVILDNKRLFLGGGGFCPTASIFFVKKYVDRLPEFYCKSPVGDNALALTLFVSGKIGYIDEVMSVRRLWVPNSWNTRYHTKISKKQKINYYNNMIDMIDSFNKITQGKWDYDVNKVRLSWYIERLKNEYNEDKIRILKDIQCKSMIHKLNLKNKIQVILKIIMPKFYKKLVRLIINLKKLIFKSEVEYFGVKDE